MSMADERREVRFQGIYAVRIQEEGSNKIIGYAEGNPYNIEKVFSKKIGKNVRTEEINVEEITSFQARSVGLEEKVLSKDEFRKLFPEGGKMAAEDACDRPFYRIDGNDFASIVGYDCNNCGGVVLGKPIKIGNGFFVSDYDYYCKRCDTLILQKSNYY